MQSAMLMPPMNRHGYHGHLPPAISLAYLQCTIFAMTALGFLLVWEPNAKRKPAAQGGAAPEAQSSHE
jgi:hypothetical protein